MVDHNSLLRRLYLDGIHGDDWLLVRDMYTDCTSRVEWAGLLSDTINIQQGVRQGGVLSTSHYKRYNNPLLLHLEDQNTEVQIGSINIPHVTVADDLAGLTRRHRDMQVMVWDIENNTKRERYCVNPNKRRTSGEFMEKDGKNLARKFFLKISVFCGVITIENML